MYVVMCAYHEDADISVVLHAIPACTVENEENVEYMDDMLLRMHLCLWAKRQSHL